MADTLFTTKVNEKVVDEIIDIYTAVAGAYRSSADTLIKKIVCDKVTAEVDKCLDELKRELSAEKKVMDNAAANRLAKVSGILDKFKVDKTK